MELGSGYSVDAEREKATSRLMELCHYAVSNPALFQRPDGATFCNRGANYIAQGMGYFAFRPSMLANDMIAHMAQGPEWREDSLDRAHRHALRGGLAFVCKEDQPHGHLCAVAPLPKQDSGSWGGPVPMVANVGPHKSHGLVRLSAAYRAADRDKIRCFLYGETA